MPALHDSCIVYVHGADELPGALKKLARRIGVAGIISEMAKRESYAGPSQRRRLKSVKARARARKTERRAMRRAMMEQAARLSPFYRAAATPDHRVLSPGPWLGRSCVYAHRASAALCPRGTAVAQVE